MEQIPNNELAIFNVYLKYIQNIYVLKKIRRTRIGKINVLLTLTFSIINKILSHRKKKQSDVLKKVLALSFSPNSIEKLSLTTSHQNILSFCNREINPSFNFIHKQIRIVEIISIATNIIIKRRKFSEVFLILQFSFEFKIFEKLLSQKPVAQVYVAEHYHRYLTIVSFLCQSFNKELIIVQHGALEYIENIPFINISSVIYSYEFSIPFYNRFFRPVHETIKFVKNDRLISDYDRFQSCELKKPTIAFLTQPDNCKLNSSILAVLKEKVNNLDCQIEIIKHPRDKCNYKEYLKHPKFTLSNRFCNNFSLVITRFSTLGVNYYLKGYNTWFVNLDHVVMDFMNEPSINVLWSMSEFKSKLNEFLAITSYPKVKITQD